jgi:hypothetical protein
MSNGNVVHLTMEVDDHQSIRRWIDFNLAPASDPLQNWDPNGYAINNTNQGRVSGAERRVLHAGHLHEYDIGVGSFADRDRRRLSRCQAVGSGRVHRRRADHVRLGSECSCQRT